MKGVTVFLAVFVIVLAITLGYPAIPPGQQIYNAIGGVNVDYPILGISVSTLVPAVFNGMVHGVVVWLVFSMLTSIGRQQKAQHQIKEDLVLPATSVQEKPMSVPIRSLEGVGSIFAEKLEAIEIKTTGDLLEAGKTSQKRDTIARKVGISPRLILEWVNRADLIRVKGVSEEYSDLLDEAGVDTVPELARRNHENLYKKLQEINEEKKLVKRLPSVSMIAEWVTQAKRLPRMVEY